MSTQPNPEDAANLGANTDQDGSTPADRAENLGANTEEENSAGSPERPADAIPR